LLERTGRLPRSLFVRLGPVEVRFGGGFTASELPGALGILDGPGVQRTRLFELVAHRVELARGDLLLHLGGLEFRFARLFLVDTLQPLSEGADLRLRLVDPCLQRDGIDLRQQGALRDRVALFKADAADPAGDGCGDDVAVDDAGLALLLDHIANPVALQRRHRHLGGARRRVPPEPRDRRQPDTQSDPPSH